MSVYQELFSRANSLLYFRATRNISDFTTGSEHAEVAREIEVRKHTPFRTWHQRLLEFENVVSSQWFVPGHPVGPGGNPNIAASTKYFGDRFEHEKTELAPGTNTYELAQVLSFQAKTRRL